MGAFVLYRLSPVSSAQHHRAREHDGKGSGENLAAYLGCARSCGEPENNLFDRLTAGMIRSVNKERS